MSTNNQETPEQQTQNITEVTNNLPNEQIITEQQIVPYSTQLSDNIPPGGVLSDYKKIEYL